MKAEEFHDITSTCSLRSVGGLFPAAKLSWWAGVCMCRAADGTNMRTHARTHTHRCTQNPRSVTRARSFSEFDILSRISYQRTNWEMHCKSNCGRICIGHIWNNNQSVYRLLLRTFTLTTLQTRPTNAHTTLFPTQSCCSWLFFPQTRWCSETNRSFCGFQRSHECPIGLSPEKKLSDLAQCLCVMESGRL